MVHLFKKASYTREGRWKLHDNPSSQKWRHKGSENKQGLTIKCIYGGYNQIMNQLMPEELSGPNQKEIVIYS